MRFALALVFALTSAAAGAQILDDPDRVPEIAKPVDGSDFPWRPAIAACRKSENLARVQFCIDQETRGHIFAMQAWDDVGADGKAAAVKCAGADFLFYARLARCIRLQVELAEQRRFLGEQREWSQRRR